MIEDSLQPDSRAEGDIIVSASYIEECEIEDGEESVARTEQVSEEKEKEVLLVLPSNKV